LNIISKFTSEFKKQEKTTTLIMGLFVSVFLPLFFSNLILLFCGIYLFYISKKNLLKVNFALLLPILFFLWMGLTFFWSIDSQNTMYSIPRQIFLLIIPLIYISNERSLKDFKDYFLIGYSYVAVFFSFLFLVRALIRFMITKRYSVFFFHGEYNNDYGLVPKELNAVHISVFIAIAFFYLLTKNGTIKYKKIMLLILLLFLALLSSSNVLIMSFILIFIYSFFYSKIANKLRLRNIIIVVTLLMSFIFYNKIMSFIDNEFKNNTQKGIGHNVINELPSQSNKVTLYDAWNKKKFTVNDFFPGTAFRVYQFRMFLEILSENNIFWQGFGLNASQIKLEEKGIKYNVFQGNNAIEGYQKKNFHNQFIQVFAELGFIGFILFVLILYVNIKNAFQNKDFIHIAFSILMISLFLTESFLWRQRGVVFFTLFYCLFNSKGLVANKK